MSAVVPSASSDISRKLGGRVPGNVQYIIYHKLLLVSNCVYKLYVVAVRIYLLDNSSKTFLLDGSVTAAGVVRMILQKLDVRDLDAVQPCFGLYSSKSGAAIDGILANDAIVTDIIEEWAGNQTAKLVFMVKLYTTSSTGFQYKDIVARRRGIDMASISIDEYLSDADIIDPQLLHLHFIQAVFNVITGYYVTTEDEAMRLGALQFINKFGSYEPSKHIKGFLGRRIVEFLPGAHLRKRKLDEWEDALLEAVSVIHHSSAEAVTSADSKAIRKYMEIVMKLAGGNMFGLSFFSASQDQFRTMPPQIVLGISRTGLSILDGQKQLIQEYGLMEMVRWGYKQNELFYVEVLPVGESVFTLQFGTNEGLDIANLLTSYAIEYMAESNRARERFDQSMQQMRAATKSSSTLASVFNSPPPPPAAETSTSSASGDLASAPAGDRKSTGPKTNVKSLMADKALKAKKVEAATKLQAVYRGYALRSGWAKEGAVILIQAVVRGFIQRCRLAKLIEELTAEQA